MRQIGMQARLRVMVEVRQPAHRLFDVGLRMRHAGEIAPCSYSFGRQMGGPERHPHDEFRPVLRLAGDPDGAAVQPDELLDQRQPDAGPLEGAAALTLDAMKPFEDPIELVRRNAHSGVFDDKLDGAVRCRSELDPDLALEGELERVGEKIEDELFPHVPVDVDGLVEGGAGDDEPQSGLVHGRAEVGGELGRESRQIRRLVARLYAPGLDAREVQQHVDELQEPQRVAMRHLDETTRLRRVVAIRSRQQLLERAQHQGQRGAELVTDVGEEGRFCPVQLRQRLGALALIFVGGGIRDAGRDLPRHQTSESRHSCRRTCGTG